MQPIDIVGGGLAGLTLGIALRRAGVPVTVWEALTYPRHRVCGEFICGVRKETLEKTGIDDLFEGAPKLWSGRWNLGNEPIFQHVLPFSAMGLSRYVLDLRLADRFTELGGELRTNERYRGDDPKRPGLVWATGRVPTKDSDLIGLKMHLTDFELHADLEMHCATGGYAGLCEIEDGRANVSCLFHKNTAVKAPRGALLSAYLNSCGMNDLAERIGNAKIDEQSHSAVSSVPCGYIRPVSKDEVCAIGDHFGMIGPFTGNGMSMAFESAATACDPLTSFANGEVSWSDSVFSILEQQRGRFKKRLRLSHAMHQLLLNPVGLRSLAVLGKLNALPVNFLFHHLR